MVQMDLAVALSQSASKAEQAGASSVQEEDDVVHAKRLSLTPGQASSAAEVLAAKTPLSPCCMCVQRRLPCHPFA
jgi:hypothetical protein